MLFRYRWRPVCPCRPPPITQQLPKPSPSHSHYCQTPAPPSDTHHADTAVNTTRIPVVERLLILGEGHHIDPDLAVFRTLRTGNTLVIRSDLQLPVPLRQQLIVRRQWTPVATPDLAAKERIQRNRNDRDEPEVDEIAVRLPPQVVSVCLVETDDDQTDDGTREENRYRLKLPGPGARPLRDRCRQRSPSVSANPPQPQTQVQNRLPCERERMGIATTVPRMPAPMKNMTIHSGSFGYHQKNVLKNNGKGW